LRTRRRSRCCAWPPCAARPARSAGRPGPPSSLRSGSSASSRG
jgi:hypothetical protein